MKLILNKYGRNAYAHHIYELLGVRELPREGMPERLIQGVRVYVKPLPPKSASWREWHGLRVMAICECGRHIPVGRLHQHKCKETA